MPAAPTDHTAHRKATPAQARAPISHGLTRAKVQRHSHTRKLVSLGLGVLLLHLWLLAGAPLPWVPAAERVSAPSVPLQAFNTRQIPANENPAATSTRMAAARSAGLVAVRPVPPPAPRSSPSASRPAKPPHSASPMADAAQATTSPAEQASDPAQQTAQGHRNPHTLDTAQAPNRTLNVDAHANDLAAPLNRAAPSPHLDLPPYPRASAEGLTQASAFQVPASAHLKYKAQGVVKGLHYSASGDLQWQHDGQSYEARLEVGAWLIGSRTQVSRGTLGAEGLMPLRFGDKTRSELAAHFQRDKGLISFSANTPDAPLLKGAQDRLSVVLQMGSLLAAEPPRFPAGTVLSFQTVSQREAEVWQFVVENDELLQLPYGELHAVKLKRQPRREFDQTIEVWLAPSLGYLPVRLRVSNANGDQVEQFLSAVEKPAP